jgi:hypothetical protein
MNGYLLHQIKRRQRREQRTITKVQDPVSGTQTTTGIVNVLSSFLRQEFRPVLVYEQCVRQMVEADQLRLSEDWKEALDKPITSDELKVATQKE